MVRSYPTRTRRGQGSSTEVEGTQKSHGLLVTTLEDEKDARK